MERKRFYESPVLDCEILLAGDVLEVSNGNGLTFDDGSYDNGIWE
jgi:hypothetical protein